jgi:hypothetical protein
MPGGGEMRLIETRAKLSHIAFLLFLSGALASCHQSSVVGSSIGPTTADSTAGPPTTTTPVQCSALVMSAKMARDISAYSTEDTCEAASNYSCESTTYSPGATASKGVDPACATVPDLGQVCMAVDTSTVPSNLNEPLTVFHCSNTQIVGDNGFTFQGRAGTLQAALASAVTKCQTRSQ